MNLDYNVSMLGEFSITYKSKSVDDQGNRSKKLWNLLEYLVANRDRAIPQSEIVELLWSDDDSDNPQGSLKVLLYRVRKSLEPVAPDNGEELIILKRSTYQWNPAVTVKTDVEVFEELIKKANDETLGIDERISTYMQAFEIYRGDYLPKNTEPWVIPIAAYYHNMYVEAVLKCVALLNEQLRYGEVVTLCRKAIRIERNNEDLYYELINSLYNSGEQSDALREYSDVTDLFYKKFAISPSDKLKTLYKTIQKTTKSLETDISIIKDDLREKGAANGAFLCEYEFFKDIYQLEARACARSGDSIYLCLITLNATDGDELSVKVTNKAMDSLIEAIHETLRKGDVVSRYSVTQYVLLLPTTTYENVEMIMKRISSSFYKKYMKKDVGVQYKLQPLDPTV